MKNYEKYAEEIRKYEGTSFCKDFIEPYILKSINAKCIDMSCIKCTTYRMIWLMEDYEEPEVDWSKVAVDTPILVRDNKNTEWIRRHFAKYEDGLIYTWISGNTSWTAEGFVNSWNTPNLQKVRKAVRNDRFENVRHRKRVKHINRT